LTKQYAGVRTKMATGFGGRSAASPDGSAPWQPRTTTLHYSPVNDNVVVMHYHTRGCVSRCLPLHSLAANRRHGETDDSSPRGTDQLITH